MERKWLSCLLLVALLGNCALAETDKDSCDFDTWTRQTSWNPSTHATGWKTDVARIWNNWSYVSFSSSYSNAAWFNDLSTEVDPFVKSPLLTNGISRISLYHKSYGSSDDSRIFAIELSTDDINWTTNALGTNTAAQTEWTSNVFEAISFDDVYVRIHSVGGSFDQYDHLGIDDIEISPFTTFLIFTNLTVTNNPSPMNTPMDITLNILTKPGASNVTAVVQYSLDSGVTYIPTNMSKVLTNFTVRLPANPTAQSIPYYIEADYEYKEVTPPSSLYPADAPASTLSIANSPVIGADREMNFHEWPRTTSFTNSTASLWSLTYARAFNNWSAASVSNAAWFDDLLYTGSGITPSLFSPQLSGGVGTVHTATKRYGEDDGFSRIFSIATSLDKANWTTNAYGTNVAPAMGWQTNSFRINAHANADYVKIEYVGGSSSDSHHLGLDDVLISYPAADVLISNVTHTLGYMYITNAVTVYCDVASANPNYPASSISPKICWRSNSNPETPWTTNTMSHDTGPAYYGTIDPLGRKGTVDYFIRCDFDGYSYKTADINESLSPAFSPEALETVDAPSSNYFYIVRPFRSDFDYLSITSTAGNAVMTLDADNTWQGAIDMTLNPQANLTFGILGFSEYTNSSPASPVYSAETKHWGDTSWTPGADIPENGVGAVGGAPITIGGGYDCPVIISLNTKSLSYLIVRGFYQDFNTWSTANSDFYELTVFGIGTTTITNDYSDWSTSTNYVSSEGDGSTAHCDNWSQPTIYQTELNPASPLWWARNTLLILQRGDGTYTNKAIALRPTTGGDANITPSDLNMDSPESSMDGIGHIGFKYHAAPSDEYPAVIKNPGDQDWTNVFIAVGYSYNTIESADASISVIARYDNGTPRSGVECRVLHEVDTKDSNNIDVEYLFMEGSVTNQIENNAEPYGSKSLNDLTKFGFLLEEDENAFQCGFYRDADDSWIDNKTGADLYHHRREEIPNTLSGNDIAILANSGDLNIEYVTVAPSFFERFDVNGAVAFPVENTNQFHKNLCWANASPRMTNEESFIVSPYLGWQPQRFSFQLEPDNDDGRRKDVNISVWSSDTREVNSSGSPSDSSKNEITNIVRWGVEDVNIMVAVQEPVNYLFICENTTTNWTRINKIHVVGPTMYSNTFDAIESTNNCFLDTRGGWTLDTTDGGKLIHPGYAGPPVEIVVETSPLDENHWPYSPGAIWTTIYTNSVTNYQWATENINLDNLLRVNNFSPVANFSPHAQPMSFRIRNNNRTEGHLILDEINMSDWHGETVGDLGTWKATEAWIDSDAGDIYVELARDRAYTNLWGTPYIQYVQSPPVTGGVSTVGFKYKAIDTPVTVAVYMAHTNSMGTDALWQLVTNSTFTVNSDSTDWESKAVTVREQGPLGIRIANISSNSPKATLLVTKMTVSDFAGIVDSTWVGNNTLITHNQIPEFDNTPGDGVRTCYLNNDAYTDVSGGGPIAPPEAYIETPRSGNGIGAVSFWFRHFEASGSPAGTLEFYVATNRAVELDDWEYLGALTGITNTTYEYFSQSFYEKDFNFMRIINGINGVANGRVCIDNILVKEPMGATLVLTNITTIPAVPLDSSPATGIEVEITKNVFEASNLTMTAYYKTGTDSWGTWAISNATDSFGMTNSNPADPILGTYRSTGTIAPQGIDEIVQYYVVCTFMGDFSNSPLTYTGFKKPSWYDPIDINTNAGNPDIPYYFTFSCTTGAVWINEYRIWNTYGTYTSQFVELCGQLNANIGDWELGINDVDGFARYSDRRIGIPGGTFLTKNETNGFAFYVIGDDGVAESDLSISTNDILQENQIVLYRSMGAYADIVKDLDHQHDSFGDVSMALIGPGSWGPDFQWSHIDYGVSSEPTWNHTPGWINPTQVVNNAFDYRYNVDIEITDTWISGSETWIVYKITGSNYYLPPVPIYTTNVTDAGSWSNVPSSSYTNVLPYPTWENTYTSWWNTIDTKYKYHRLSVTNILTP